MISNESHAPARDSLRAAALAPWLVRAYGWTMTLVAVLALVRGTLGAKVLTAPLVGLTGLLLLLAIAASRGGTRRMVTALVVLALGIGVWARVPVGIYPEILARWADLAVMVACVPMISYAFERRGYVQAAVEGSQLLGTHWTGLVLAVTAHLLGAILLVSALPLIGSLAVKGVSSDTERNLRGDAILRGYSASVMWSPSFGSVGIALLTTGLQWTEYLRVGVGLAVISLVVQFLWSLAVRFFERPAPSRSRVDRKTAGPIGRKLVESALAIGVLLTSVLLLERVLPQVSVFLVVSVVALALSGGLYLLTGEPGAYLRQTREHFLHRGARQSGEVAMFLGGGLLGGVIQRVVADTALSSQIGRAMAVVRIPPAWSLSLAVILLAVAGIAPIVAVTLASVVLTPQVTGLPPLVYAGSLLLGSSLSLQVAPFTPSALLLGAAIERSAFVLVRRNLVWAVFLFATLQASLTLFS